MTKANIALNHGTLTISGELSRHSVAQIKKNEYVGWFAHGAVNVDLSKVSKADTAGLAWLFYLLEQASLHSCQLNFSNIPEKLTKLIALSGVDGLLPTTCD
ncbi:lipid asymmetry maintenance protein MlaB [Colwellia psychrerythraea]|uniref:Sulfate transporter/antisigma-factor antagonist STAS n=1 Tax=Colwellia psychrerythraea TaxID=28229 RepID=A0A099KQ29_COLPS|nr:STAS domain-containing protein [Colwellia psychrerythraea]KGJ92330.1 Sulfate transporter/antisigma-factor antagonist STAS [Colwellia psychrerythraea]